VQSATVVVRGTERGQIEPHDFAARHGDVAAGREPGDPVVNGWRGGRVVQIDEAVEGEHRIEGDADQPSFADGTDRQRDKRCGQYGAVLDHADDSALLRDEDPSVRRHGHRRRFDEAAGNDRFAEALTQSRCTQGPIVSSEAPIAQTRVKAVLRPVNSNLAHPLIVPPAAIA